LTIGFRIGFEEDEAWEEGGVEVLFREANVEESGKCSAFSESEDEVSIATEERGFLFCEEGGAIEVEVGLEE